MDDSRNDAAFEAVLQNTGNIDPFIDSFFSFLARRTDFFVESPPEGGQVGFPPGIAAKLIISKFKKWESYRKEMGFASDSSAVRVPEPVKTVDIVTSNAKESSVKKESSPKTQKAAAPSKPMKTDDDEKKSNNLWESHNGRKTDKYSWSQSITELDVHIAVGKEVMTKRDLEVKILGDRITVKVPSAAEPVVVDWKLPHLIVKDESYWSLYPGEEILMCLQKARERWWDHIFEGEEVIDRTKIEAVRPMEDLHEEDQAKIHELVYNEERKMKGLPTTEQMKLEETMRKAWDAEGSPFKGQPFDPSRVQLASNTIGQPSD